MNEQLAASWDRLDDTLETLEQMEEEALTTPDGLVLTTAILDGEHRITLHLRDSAKPWVQVACRVDLADPGNLALHAAFGIDALQVALREDLEPQAEAVDVMASVLDQVFGNLSVTLIAALRAAWERTRARLEVLWRKAEEEGVTPDRMCLRRKGAKVSLAMCGRGTRYASDSWYGIYLVGTGDKFRSRGFASGKSETVERITSQGLAELPYGDKLSGHDKLRLLSGNPGSDHARARAAFDETREVLSGASTVVPSLDPDLLVLGNSNAWDAHLLYADGAQATMRLHDRDDPPSFQIVFDAPDKEYGLRIESRDSGKLDIAVVDENGVSCTKSKLLDAAMCRVVALILARDEPLPDGVLLSDADSFDPEHPLLAEVDVPPRHRRLISAMLDAAYPDASTRSALSALWADIKLKRRSLLG